MSTNDFDPRQSDLPPIPPQQETDGAQQPVFYDPQSYYTDPENQGLYSSWANENPEAEEEPKKRTIFKPRTRKPSFILGVFINSIRMLVLFILLLTLTQVANGLDYVGYNPRTDEMIYEKDFLWD